MNLICREVEWKPQPSEGCVRSCFHEESGPVLRPTSQIDVGIDGIRDQLRRVLHVFELHTGSQLGQNGFGKKIDFHGAQWSGSMNLRTNECRAALWKHFARSGSEKKPVGKMNCKQTSMPFFRRRSPIIDKTNIMRSSYHSLLGISTVPRMVDRQANVGQGPQTGAGGLQPRGS